jgi:predicted nucleic acid-binding protein
MAGSARYAAVLDACVLYPAPLRDLLLSLAQAGLYHARWTDDIHDEWTRNLLAERPDLDPAQLRRTRELMNQSVPDALVTQHLPLVDSLRLPDPDDRHVLAAAIAGHADAIVTFNLKDFPASALAPHGIEAQHPDDFILNQFELSSFAALAAVKAMRARLRNPPRSAQEFIATLQQQQLPQSAAWLRQAAELI